MTKISIENKNVKLLIRLFIAILASTLFVLLMDYDLLKSIYDVFYGDSEVTQYFKDQEYNILTDQNRMSTFRLVISRFIYTILPIAVFLFIMIYYHSKHLSEKLVNTEVFKNNGSLARIIMISRYALGIMLAFFILNHGRTYYNSTFHNCMMGNEEDFLRVILACIVIWIFTLDWGKLYKDLRTFSQRRKILTIVLFMFFISVVSCCLLEFQVGSKMRLIPYTIHVNIGYWFLLQLALLALFRRPKIGAFVSLFGAYAIGLANDIVCQFRGNYIMFGDLTVVRTALEVAGNYDYKPGFWFWFSLIILVAMVAFVILVKLPGNKKRKKKADKIKTAEIEADEIKSDDKKAEETETEEIKSADIIKDESKIDDSSKNVEERKKKENIKEEKTTSRKSRILKRVITTIVYEGIIVLFVIITMRNGLFYGRVQGVGWDYNKNVSLVGYMPYFISNMDRTRKIELEGYTPEKAKEALDRNDEPYSGDKEEVKEPNIIIIQNEAFADLSITVDLETDCDTMPFIHSMSENTQKGYMNMSITGGPTANTEFEVLTGSTIGFLPYGVVPYTQYIKGDTPSIASKLKNQPVPYNTVAYHSYYSSGYNRNSVYDYLGFDRKEFENNYFDDFPESEIKRGYLSDKENYNRVIEMFEENQGTDSPFFCFNVTIQGHGGYTGGPYDLGESVKVTNFDAPNSINTYLSNVKLSDSAFKYLIEYFEKVDEPTVIFMYGDHQPAFDGDAKKLLNANPAWSDERTQAVSNFYVPYILWANFDIEECDGLIPYGVKAQETDKWDYASLNKLSTNYAGAYVMNQSGVKLSEYDNMLMNIHEDVPAITAVGMWGKDGNTINSSSGDDTIQKIYDLQMVQYNLIFDKKNKLIDYYLP